MAPAAGWYPDPCGRAWSRFWNGDRWLEWVDGTDDLEDRLTWRDELGPPLASDRLTIASAHPPKFGPSKWVDMSSSDAESYLRKEAERRRSGCWITASLVVLWVIGGFATLVFAAMAKFGSEWTCADSSWGNDRPQNCETSIWPIIAIGFGLITLITVIVVRAYWKRWRDTEACGTVTSRS